MEDYLSIISKDSLDKRWLSPSENADTYYVLYNGSLICFKLLLIDLKNTAIEISLPDNANEESLSFVKDIEKQIWEKFIPSALPFGFGNLISDDTFRNIMEERWSESLKTQKAGAYLSTIILLGGILEGILHCRILKDTTEAMKSICIPIDSVTGSKKPINQWMLNTMINVCKDRGWIDSDVSKFSHEVMEYRNLVHPYQQLKSGLPTPTINTCDISRTVVESALRNLIKT